MPPNAWYDSISATVLKKQGARAQLPRTSSSSDIASDPLTRRGSAERSAEHGPGGDGSLPMSSKWTNLAAAGVLSLCTAVPALAGSVTQPGETVGLNAGAPLPQGWYAINTVDWGCRNTNPQHTCTGLTIPVIAWSTPWTLFGGRVQLLAAWPAVEVGVQRTTIPEGTLPGTYFNGKCHAGAGARIYLGKVSSLHVMPEDLLAGE